MPIQRNVRCAYLSYKLTQSTAAKRYAHSRGRQMLLERDCLSLSLLMWALLQTQKRGMSLKWTEGGPK